MSNTTLKTMCELLDLVGITRVIWIDDKFDALSGEQPDTNAELISRVAYLKTADKLPDDELFVSFRSNADQDERWWFESEIQGDADKLNIARRLVNDAWAVLEHETFAAMVPELPRATATSGSDEAGRDGASTSNSQSEEAALDGEEKAPADGVFPAVQTAAADGHVPRGSGSVEGDTPPPPVAEQATAEASEGTRSEYKEADIEAIKAALGERLATHGLTSWRTAKDGILSAIDKGTLFLIDLEFKIGGENRAEGKDIASSVLSYAKGLGIVIVLTHSTSIERAPEFQAALSRELESDHGLDKPASERLMVIPKQSDASGSETAVEQLGRWLRVSFTLQTCFDFVDGMAKEMTNEIDGARKAIRQQSVYHLDDAVFESSLNEGALEFDVLSRVFLTRQRVAAERFLGKERESHRCAGPVAGASR